MKTKISIGTSRFWNHLRGLALTISLLLLLSLVFPVSAAPALDGEGTMFVTPTSVPYGSIGNTFTFTFTANIGDFGAGSQVALTVPVGWTTPTTAVGAGHITVSSGTCTLSGSPPFGITGSTIFIDMASCTTGQSFTLTYAGVTAPAVTGSPYSFLTQTDIGPGGGGLVDITAGSPLVTVDPATLTISATGLTPQNKIYDGTTDASLAVGSPTLVGIIGNDTVSLITGGATGTFADKHIGTAKIVTIAGLTLSGASAGNYTLTPPTRSATITKKPITITAIPDTKIYDGTTSSTGLPTQNIPLATGDTVAWLQAFNHKHVGTGKTITPSGTVNDGNNGLNYAYTFNPDITGVITTRAITITAATDSKEYDGSTSSSGVPSLSAGTPLGTGDTEPTWTQTFDDKNVGINKTLTAAGKVADGNGGFNYSYTFTPVSTGTITTKPITVSAVAKSKTYGAVDPVLTYTVSPALITGDNLSGALTRSPGTDVGSYAITKGTLDNSNYAITYTGADLTITKAMLTVTANNQTINIGEGDPLFSFDYSGFMYSETSTVINTTPTCGVSADHTLPGNYSIACSGGEDNNYDFAYVNGILKVTAIPTLLTPVADENLLSNNPAIFDWVDIASANGYTIQVASNNTFAALLVNKVVNAPASSYRANLPPNKTLFWRVRSFGPYGTSAWAPYRSFVTANPPSIPALVAPALNALVKIYNPTLDWSNSTLPTGTAFGRYRVQIASDAIFTSALREYSTNETVITESSLVPSPDLSANTKYYWRVRAENSLNQYSAWSTIRSFRAALLPVGLNALPNGNHPFNLRPTFSWSDPNLSAPLATSYTIQIAANSAFKILVDSGTAPTNASSYTPAVNLPAGKALYWRVRANGANGPSLWSSSSFTTPTPPSVPSLLLPTKNSLTNHTPLLKWSMVTVTASTTFAYYQVQVDDDPLFGSPIVNDISLILRTQNQLTTLPLPHNTKFYWRVLAFNNLGQYSTSTVWSFRTRVDAPILSSPTDGAPVGTRKPTFEWIAAGGPGVIRNYTIQVSASSLFNLFLINSNPVSSTFTPLANLPAGKTLYWRVRVNGANGPSLWSTVFSFTTP